MERFELLQTVHPRNVRVALAECEDRVEKGLVMRPNHVRPLIGALLEQEAIIRKFQKTAHHRQISFDAAMAHRAAERDRGAA